MSRAMEGDGAEAVICAEGISKTFEVRAVEEERPGPWLGSSRRVEKRRAVRNVSFTVPRGCTVGIIGANGAGKSTLLKMVTGILRPDSGWVSVQGSVTPIIGLQAGFSPQLSGVENIYVKGAALGMNDREVEASMDRIRDFSGLGPALNRPFKTYSNGMRMRLAFSLAFLDIPEVLIVDETLAVGDEVFRRKSMSRIEEIKDAGATILLASHAAELMRGFCDRILLMDEGELLMDDLPDVTLEAYQRLAYADPAVRREVRRSIERDGHGRVPPMAGSRKAGAMAGSESDGAPAVTVGDRGGSPGVRWARDSRPLGGQITGCQILGLDGNEIRTVVSGGRVRARVTARFGQPARDVSLRLGISTPDGFDLGGLVLTPDEGGDSFVGPGQTMVFTGTIRLPLAAGTYHAGAELRGYVGDEQQCLHRRLRLCELQLTGTGPSIEGPVCLAGET